MIAIAITRIGNTVDNIPVERPAIMFVATPVDDSFVMYFTCLYLSEV